MRRCVFFIILFLLVSIGVSAQNIAEINADIGIPDSLAFNKEIRIYQSHGTTNYSSLFRMYEDEFEKWNTEFYEHFAKIEGVVELRIKKELLTPKDDYDYVFLNLIRSHIMDLPEFENITWKLIKRNDVEKVKDIYRGETIEYYEYPRISRLIVLDGLGFRIQAKNEDKSNSFDYPNPEGYLKHFPDIDELIYMNEILTIIKDEFDIWKK